MKLSDIYKQLKAGDIDLKAAAEQFGISEIGLKIRISKHGDNLPRVLKTLDRIAADQISREAAAEYLKVQVRTINLLMETWHVKRPARDAYLVTRAKASIKWEIRKKYAIDFIAGSDTLESAAEGAEVSVRQIRRWVSELLEKHYQMVFKDLKGMRDSQRKRLADEIETAEGLEIEKQQVLKQIADGHRAVQDVAMERVRAKRTRNRPNV